MVWEIFCLFCWHSLQSIALLEGSASENKYKINLTKHLYPVKIDFYTNSSDLSQNDHTPIKQGMMAHSMV